MRVLTTVTMAGRGLALLAVETSREAAIAVCVLLVVGFLLGLAAAMAVLDWLFEQK